MTPIESAIAEIVCAPEQVRAAALTLLIRLISPAPDRGPVTDVSTERGRAEIERLRAQLNHAVRT